MSVLKPTFADEFVFFSQNINAATDFPDVAVPPVPTGIWATRYWWGSGLRTLGNGELQYFSDATVGANPFSVVGGVLNITAAPSVNPAATAGLPYTSGIITTEGTFAQTYGWFEIRAQLPAGQGLWPAFWLMPQDHTWPPELDVMEVLGKDPTTLYNFAHSGTTGQDVFVGGPTSVPDLSKGFHDFSVLWTPERVQWYLNGNYLHGVDTPADMHKPMYLLAGLGIGGEWGGPPDATTTFPASLQIEYIRAFPYVPPDFV